MELFVPGKSFSIRSCSFHRSISKRDRRLLYDSSNESSFENKLDIKNLVGESSCQPNDLSANVLSAKCLWVKGPVDQTSVGLVSVGQTSGHGSFQLCHLV